MPQCAATAPPKRSRVTPATTWPVQPERILHPLDSQGARPPRRVLRMVVLAQLAVSVSQLSAVGPPSANKTKAGIWPFLPGDRDAGKQLADQPLELVRLTP